MDMGAPWDSPDDDPWDYLLEGASASCQALCGDRVSQMTKTYNDIEAVTRLLQEKERDLELAARIGQRLLGQNQNLESSNAELVAQLQQANDQIQQLKHDIAKKNALLHVYYEDFDEDADQVDSGIASEKLIGSHVDDLEKKLSHLEQENLELKSESEQLKIETDAVEEKEASLVADCVRELQDKTWQVEALQEELTAKCESSQKQQEEIQSLTTQILAMQAKNSRLSIENAELQKHLSAAVEAQKDLTEEISARGEQYDEVLSLLQEAQEESKELRRKQRPAFIRHHYSSLSPYVPHSSLALELEDSFKREAEYPPGYSPEERQDHSKRVMGTVRHVRVMSTSSSCQESESASEVDSELPYRPGAQDLQTALRRLATRKANEINDRMIQQQEQDKLNRRLRQSSDGPGSPDQCPTPDSYMSTGSGSNLSDLSRLSNGTYRIPEKLQIVKPLEGSHTLHHWQRLATPHLGGLMEHRPGVQNRGDRHLDFGHEESEEYLLSDYEEDGTWKSPFISRVSTSIDLHKMGEADDGLKGAVEHWIEQCQGQDPFDLSDDDDNSAVEARQEALQEAHQSSCVIM
ncbi:hypothetical protein CAPTEDRAFT_229053 [Capitella teleta]|uniref:HAP1 N-terminal domain-containing protein n=1 Tax=Capitella teleta TaxID=283909 RepID=X2B1B0_CAPTE|nr:hypothetical protein CAPTEDRAFT_229053 [Capitella teleta]|eukprot:ELU00243.1 hypothetical protein CAPTEDRAFT_229053 [Capitella teleta]